MPQILAFVLNIGYIVQIVLSSDWFIEYNLWKAVRLSRYFFYIITLPKGIFRLRNAGLVSVRLVSLDLIYTRV